MREKRRRVVTTGVEESARETSNGDELWQNRKDLLQHLYHQGAIGPDLAATTGQVREAIGVDQDAMRGLVSSLRDGQLVSGRGADQASLHLTGRGFVEARELVEKGRRPLV